ncbi:innexin inx3-like isoform X1 [Myzus persicae]|uniref:innexin inx3-like isoform X1 n=1 Tax=Myzus persicae TaxID=13164 RepID=UPI000B932D55|nr:innexin inx3-like isoform X1 [Myzus persicae]XP_022174270.1 innexin inx3-like isoform X1 [Myzus persicae]XP_022174271.1 innexin inx3-like isoform X1 [Myzus persicae]XP_022174272.1 innexin inx3-like isoform X1 [Myzus persicae]
MIPISSFDVIAKSFKVRNYRPVIDDCIFQCHYKLTTNILLTFCLLVSSINLIGNPIECITNSAKKTEMHKVINSYCWMSNLYTSNVKQGFGLPYTGNNERNIRSHSYYKWVPFMLFFQAMTFYVPHWIWKIWEGGKIRMITNGMRGFCEGPAKSRRIKQDRLVQYFIESFHTHSTYGFGYILCEIMNIFNVGFNIYITHKFLGETFLTYGIEVLKYYQHPNYFNPMEDIFPRLTKCNFFKYGSSGTIQNIDAMCILAQNVLNEKIYLFIWIWFLMLAIISIFTLVYRITIIMQIVLKRTLLINMSKFTNSKRIISMLVRKFQTLCTYNGYNPQYATSVSVS